MSKTEGEAFRALIDTMHAGVSSAHQMQRATILKDVDVRYSDRTDSDALTPRPSRDLVTVPDIEEAPVFLYAHELLENGGGIWLGCAKEDVVRKSYDEGETGEEVVALIRREDHLAVVASMRSEIERLRALVKVSP